MSVLSPDDSPTVTSTSLLLRIRSHDPAAWERFVRLYTPLIYSWCRRAGLQPNDAEDVCQETLRSVLGGIERYHRTGSFRGWLWQVARFRVQDFYRRQQRHPQGAGGTDFFERIQSVTDGLTEESSTSAASDPLLVRALAMIEREFEPTTWRAFWLMTVDHLSALEVARQLGWCESGDQRGADRARQAKSRVVRRVREEFGELLDLSCGDSLSQ